MKSASGLKPCSCAKARKEQAGWTCEVCGAKQGEIRWGKVKHRFYTVWLAAAHLNHDPENPHAKLAVDFVEDVTLGGGSPPSALLSDRHIGQSSSTPSRYSSRERPTGWAVRSPCP